MFLLAVLCVGLFSWWLALRGDAALREDLLGRARLAAVVLSRDHLAGMLYSEEAAEADELSHLRQHLFSLRRGLAGCRSAALLGQWGTGAPAVLALGEFEPESGGRPRLAFTEQDTLALALAINDGQASVAGPLDDALGRRVGVYVPLGLGGGRPIVLRLDMDADQWRLAVAARCVLPVTTLCLALGMLFWLLVAPARRPGRARSGTWRVLPPTVLLTLCLLLGFWLFLRARQEQQAREETARRVHATAAGLQKTLDVEGAHLLALTDAMLAADTGQTADMLARRDAGALLARFRGAYRTLSREHGVTHMYFLTPDGACLLRAHDPARAGGVVDRHPLREARRPGRPATGLELGVQGVFTLRAVTPVSVRGGRVGFIELGREIEDALENLNSDPQVELAVILRKDLLRRADWEAGMHRLGRAPDWERLAREVVSFSTLGALSPEFDDAALSALRIGGEPREVQASGRQWRISAAPLADATGRQAATLVILEDVSAAKAAFQRLELVSLLGLGAVFGLLCAFFFVLLRRTDQGILEREEALRMSEDTARKLSRAVEQSPATVVITDLSGAIEYVNPKFTETTGYPPEEALGQNPRILKSGDMPAEGYRALPSRPSATPPARSPISSP